MDNTINVGMGSKDLVQCLLICDVDLVEVWSLAAEELDAVEGDFGGIVQAVDDHNLVAMLEEGERGEGAYVTGSTESKVSVWSLEHFGVEDGGANQDAALPSG